MQLKKILCVAIAGMIVFSLAGCGNKSKPEEPSVEVSEIPQTDAEITSTGIKLVTGIVTKLEGDTISTNGVWMTEAQVGQVAKTFTSETYKCERGSLKQDQVKFVSVLYNINNEIACSIYFDNQMNMYYNNKYLVIAPDIKSLYKEISETINQGSIIEFPTDNSNHTEGGNGTINSNNDLSVSTAILQTNIGFDEQSAKTLAESAAKVGVPTIMKAEMVAQDVIRTHDISENTYLIGIQGGAILYIYNEATIMYMYAADGYDTRYAPNIQPPQDQQMPSTTPDITTGDEQNPTQQDQNQQTPVTPSQTVDTTQPTDQTQSFNQPQVPQA